LSNLYTFTYFFVYVTLLKIFNNDFLGLGETSLLLLQTGLEYSVEYPIEYSSTRQGKQVVRVFISSAEEKESLGADGVGVIQPSNLASS